LGDKHSSLFVGAEEKNCFPRLSQCVNLKNIILFVTAAPKNMLVLLQAFSV
jgi:hypothetical protein